MRFWQKIFLISLTVLTIAVNIIAFMLIGNNHELNKRKEIDSSVEMYRLVVSSLQINVMYGRYRSTDTEFGVAEISQIITDFAYQFALEKLTIQLNTKDGDKIFSNSSQDPPPSLLDGLVESGSGRMIIEKNQDTGNIYLYLSHPITLQNDTYLFTTVKDITDIYDVKNEQLFFFSIVGPALSFVVALIVLVISRLLTQQIYRLQRSTKRVAQGDYQPIPIKSSDEIGMLTSDFNKMTDAVRQKVEELEQVAQARKKFIDNMTHEMKTPLTSIIGFSDLLRTARLDEDTIQDYAQSIYTEGQYLKSVSSKLMELILLGQNPELCQLSVPILFGEISAAVEPISASRGVIFRSIPVSSTVVADPELIKSLLYNLIDNAIKASPPQKEVTLSAHITPEGRLAFSVADQGGGVPENQKKKIFEPFYRVDKSRSREVGGAGLGLALCAEIAKAHHASLEIQSAPQQGTVITIQFPKEGETLS